MDTTGSDRVVEGLKKIEEGMNLLRRGPLEYDLKCLLKAQELLITVYAPFKVGDEVELSKTPDIDAGSGWRGSKHFLVEGAVATVRGVEVDSQGLCFTLEFDNETYLHYHTNEPIAPEKKHGFCFRADSICKAPRKCHGCGCILTDVFGGLENHNAGCDHFPF
jgi:hypothetical protein